MMERKIVGDSILFCVENKTVLTLKEYERDGSIVIQLSGELRSDFVHDFQDELIALATVGAAVIVDLKDLSYLSPTAQHSFLTVQRKMDSIQKGSLTLCNLSEAIYQEFESTGASELLMIE